MKSHKERNGEKASGSKVENQAMKYSGASFGDLPPCVLLEIFLRLPTLAAISCKCVCKSWYGQLSDLCFTNIYNQNPSHIDLLFSNIMITLCSSNPEDQADAFHLLEFSGSYDSGENNICPRKLNILERGRMLVNGSCKGLICLVQYQTSSTFVQISNPVTAEFISLPRLSSARKLLNSAYGFGFSTHYKALRISILHRLNGEIRVEGEIFTIGVDKTWRKLADNSRICCLQGFAVTVNKTFHSIVVYKIPEYVQAGNLVLSNIIYAFDINEERFKLIQPPLEISRAHYSTDLSLGLLRNSLCLFDNSRANTQLDIWTMKRYGITEFWTKDYVLNS